MNLKLIPILGNEDSTQEIYQSPDCQELIQIYKEYYPKIGFQLPWVGYFIFNENEIVGSCGFTESPKNKTVEIAYWTFSKFENQGIASFACKELIQIAQNENPNLEIVAKTAPEKNASTSILEKNNFIFKEIVQDHEIGDAWLWKFVNA